MPRRSLQITRARVIQCVLDPGRASTSVYILLDGELGRKKLHGAGKASLNADTLSATVDAAWALLPEALKPVLGSIRVDAAEAHWDEVAALVTRVRQLAPADPAADACYQNIVASLEGALADIVADATKTPVPASFAGSHRTSTGREDARSIDLTDLAGTMARYAEAPENTPPPVKYGQLDANRFEVAPLEGFGLGAEWGVTMISHMMERAALAHGLDTVRESIDTFVAYRDELPHSIAFSSTRSIWTSNSSLGVTSDKEVTRRLLAEAGVDVPEGAAFDPTQRAAAIRFALSLGGPLVVKPVRGSHGRGVATDLRSKRDIIRAVVRAAGSPTNTKFLVERCVPGGDYRFVVVGDRVISVVHNPPAYVMGDGRTSVIDLIFYKNISKLRNPHARRRLIKVGSDAKYWLKRQGLTIDSIPVSGRKVRLSSAGNGSLGADTVEVLDETHQSLRGLAVRATQAVPGLDHAGVDIVAADHRLATAEQTVAVIEVNGEPGTALNTYPFFGPPRDASGAIVRRSYELLGIEPPAQRDRMEVRIVVDGTMPGQQYRDWLSQIGHVHGVECSVRQRSPHEVEATVNGALQPVATVASRAFSGPYGKHVRRVSTCHVERTAPHTPR